MLHLVRLVLSFATTMDPQYTQYITLIAAVVAASTSICTLFVNLFAQYRSEMRAAFRKSVEPHLGPLGQNLYETMACSRVLSEKNDEAGQSRVNWKARADKSRDELKRLRLAVRYSLWGLDEPLRVITRVPNWIDHNKGNKEQTDALMLAATALREAIDNSVRRAYAKGRPFTWWERRSLAAKAKRVRKQYSSGAPAGLDDEENGS